MLDSPLSLASFVGTWYIHYTNFPMWLKGDKQQPIFNYALGTRGGRAGLEDVVRYIQGGKTREIVGFDTPKEATNTQFRWRGRGLLWLFVSEWEIQHLDTSGEWALIYFSKTLATPAGYDVIARSAHLTAAQRESIEEALRARGLLAALTVLRT